MLIILDQDTDPPECVPEIGTLADFLQFLMADIPRLHRHNVSMASYREGRFVGEMYCTEAGWLWNLAEMENAAP
jgi:hypothetical protein